MIKICLGCYKLTHKNDGCFNHQGVLPYPTVSLSQLEASLSMWRSRISTWSTAERIVKRREAALQTLLAMQNGDDTG